ncbi:phospholipid carrier-dependent glycosyltransferase [Sphingomonas aerophila]|uniref:Polyprenol-phosphate-mannose--protein mannosyltransferase n=1 Tax=Sphingomonas aerophila TaxID=1344948 RepID=A0A7W9EV32_9SPHN|nr:dolichyl-phosphate-mannose--protein O-mannosyl transferase [Sphingomonas aerophila]
MPIKFDRPLPVAILLGIITQALFCWRLAVPHMLVFDEVHYVPAARTLLTLAHPANAEHPLLGKELIALGVWMFGDTPVGWRAMSTLAGTATVLGCYAALWLLYRRVWTATLGAVLVLLNFTVFIQSRIAMLDGFMAAFVVLALACLLWSAKANGAEAVWARWIGGAMFLGLAVACKWAAAPYVLFAALAFLLLKRGNPHRWPGLSWWAGPIMLGVVSVATYLATFMPAFFYATEPISVSTLLPYQLAMFKLQEQVLPPHTYQSSWEGWVLMIRPIWYLYEPVDGAQRGILFVGNPVIMWGGLVAVAASLWAWARERDVRTGALAGLWVASYLVWALVPKSPSFFYYYYLPSIWLPLVLAGAIHHWHKRGWHLDEALLGAAAVLFINFYPVLAATALDDPGSFHRWTWFASWI